MEVIKLEHSFVNGRRYGLRTNEVSLPGIADVLAGVLQLGDFGAVVKQPSMPVDPATITEELLPAQPAAQVATCAGRADPRRGDGLRRNQQPDRARHAGADRTGQAAGG